MKNDAIKNFMIINISKAIATTFFFTTLVQFMTSDATTIQKKTIKLFKIIKKTIKILDITQALAIFDITSFQTLATFVVIDSFDNAMIVVRINNLI